MERYIDRKIDLIGIDIYRQIEREINRTSKTKIETQEHKPTLLDWKRKDTFLGISIYMYLASYVRLSIYLYIVVCISGRSTHIRTYLFQHIILLQSCLATHIYMVYT